MHHFRLGKEHKLCSATAIDQLFSRDGADTLCSSLAYPLRCVWRSNPRRSSGAPVQIVIMVPKRRLRHAVDRVTMRRRIREAYRLNRHTLSLPDGLHVDLALVYVADALKPYADINKSMTRLLAKLRQSFNTTEQ